MEIGSGGWIEVSEIGFEGEDEASAEFIEHLFAIEPGAEFSGAALQHGSDVSGEALR